MSFLLLSAYLRSLSWLFHLGLCEHRRNLLQCVFTSCIGPKFLAFQCKGVWIPWIFYFDNITWKYRINFHLSSNCFQRDLYNKTFCPTWNYFLTIFFSWGFSGIFFNHVYLVTLGIFIVVFHYFKNVKDKFLIVKPQD